VTGVSLLRLAIGSVFLAALAPTWADPDLWGHLRFGADIVAAGAIPVRDPYAFTSAPTWVSSSWLGDVLMHVVYAWGGTLGLITGKIGVASALIGLTAAALRRAGVRRPLHELLLFVCLAALYPSIPTFRPQLFSLLAFAVLLRVLGRAETGPVTWLLAAPVILAAWANLHGAWLLGVGTLGLWTAGELVTTAHGWRHRVALAALGLLAVLGTLATPYGIALWTQLQGTVGSSLRDVPEWRGLFETGSPALAVWVALTGIGIVAVAASGARPSHVLVLAWLAWQSWHVRRLLPFFGLATLTLLAPAIARVAERPKAATDTTPRTVRPAIVWLLSATALLLIAFNAWRAAGALGCLQFDESREADVRAAGFMKLNRLHGRLLTYSDWGSYAIWHLAPALEISMDGRREFAYSLAEIARHNAIYWNAPSALDDVAALAPDYIWLPTKLPVLPTLAHGGWTTIFSTERSAVLARPSATTYVMPASAPSPRCFPADPP
jgi:hypothetical protein